jgi:hypothetical protein
MPEFNRLKALALRHARREEPDSQSAGALDGATPAAPSASAPAATPGAPTPVVPLGALGKLRATLSHASHALGAHRVEFATAFYQHTKHGRKTGSTRFVHGGNPHRPDPSSVQSSGTQTPALPAQLVSEVIGPNVAGAATVSTAPAAPQGEWQALIAAAPIDTITSPDTLRAHVRQLFEHPSRPGTHASVLARSVYDLAAQSELQPKTEAAAAMRGALLALALRQAGATDVAGAQLALERIASLDFDAPHKSVSVSDADRQAWHAVRLLARSTEGFGILDALRAATGEPFKDDLHRTTFKTLLESAEALAPLPTSFDEAMSHDGAPGAVASRMKLGAAPLTSGEPGPQALARRAFDAASTRLEHGRDALTADQKGALFAWQQSFTEDGRNTDLSKVRERLNKFASKTIPRVDDSRWKTLLPRLVHGKQGSPLSALRLGTQGATRKTAKQEQALYQQALRDSLATLGQSPALQPAAVLGHARPKHSLVELAALHVWLESGGFAHGRMDEAAIVAVARRAQRMCADLEQADEARPGTLADLQKATARWAAMTPRQLAKTKPFRKAAKRAYTPERLALWGKVARVPDDSPFWAKLDELRSLARPTGPTLPTKPFIFEAMEELTGPFRSTVETERIDDVRALLEELVETLPSSARLRLADGGRQGFSTSGLNGMTHAHGMPISPRLTLRASRTRETVVEFSHGTHGFEMFVGRAKTAQRQAGAGVLVGYDVETALTNLRVGLATNVTVHSKELVEASGVTVRVPHRVKADGSGFDDKATRAQFWAVVAHFLDEATRPHGDGANGTFNRLAELCLDHPDVSISWTDTHSTTSKRGVTVDATANAKLFSFGPLSARNSKTGKTAKLFSISAGPSVGIGWEKSKQTGGSSERTGRHRIEQRYIGGGHLTQLRGGVAPGFTHSLDASGRSSVGLLSLDALVATLGLGENGSTAKLTLSIENDKLNYRASTLEREELDSRRYAKAIDGARAALVQTLVANSEAQPAGAAATSAALVDPAASAGARIDEYVDTVHRNRQFNHAYKYSFRLLRDPAASIDLLTALAQQTGNDPDVAAFVAARRDRVLADPRAWVPRKLSIRERNGATRSPGLSAGVSLNVRTSATGDHEFANLSVPFPVLESIDEQGY